MDSSSVWVTECDTYYRFNADTWQELAVLAERLEQNGIKHIVQGVGHSREDNEIRAYKDQGNTVLAWDKENWLLGIVQEYMEEEDE